ncbi:MAG: hypothetical protein AAFW75_27430 [Cyanobacteria bacterium J06636_16]
MKITDLRRHPQWVILGFVMMAATIGGALRFHAHQDQPLASESSLNQETRATHSVEPWKSSVGPVSTHLEAADPSTLLIATPPAEARSADLPGTGRPDPFTSVLQAVARPQQPSLTPNLASTTATPENANTGASPATPTTPATSVSNTVNLPPVPAVTLSPPVPLPLPSIPVANTPPVPIPSLPAYSAPVDPLQAIELSGVVQLGDRVAVIVREANDKTSRHLFAGDFLSGGQVKVKSIDLSSQEPLIIFEYQGKEYTRIVGS